ncbi:hypothetical protein ACJZ2D_003508 [Fusarium nematophilum]
MTKTVILRRQAAWPQDPTSEPLFLRRQANKPAAYASSVTVAMLRRPARCSRALRQCPDAVPQPPSPSDSTYGSAEDSPGPSPILRPKRLYSLDGADPCGVPAATTLDEEEPKTPPSKQQRNNLESLRTPERASLGENIDHISPFLYTRSPISLPLQDRRLDSNKRRLDRYVPKRDHAYLPSERYRTAKDCQDLSVEERLTRNKDSSVDPFVVRRRALTPDQRFPFRVDETDQNRGTALSLLPQNRGGERQVSVGAVWSVGGLVPSTIAVDDGQGHLLHRGTNARFFPTPFQEGLINTSVENEKHEGRIASALDLDRIRKILNFNHAEHIPRSLPAFAPWSRDDGQTTWDGCQWINREYFCNTAPLKPARRRLLPAAPVLDAPNLKDDFYCSPLAYSSTARTLVVCLGNLLYAWSETAGVHMIHGTQRDTWLTSVAFSSARGTKAVLGIGHSDGSVVLKSLFDGLPRFEVRQPFSIACVSWRPTCTLRPSKNPLNPDVPVQTEDLVVGDEMGNVYYYIVEWPMGWEVSRDTWPGAVSLIAKISNIHCQQVCGLAWSSDRRLFATGGNDNLCCLFEADRVIGQRRMEPARREDGYQARLEAISAFGGIETRVARPYNPGASDPATGDDPIPEVAAEMQPLPMSTDSVRYLGPGAEKHHWDHHAAVKAIAFCP